MTDVNNISEVPFVAAEAHTSETFCKNTTIINTMRITLQKFNPTC
jgi:hypothetical protein